MLIFNNVRNNANQRDPDEGEKDNEEVLRKSMAPSIQHENMPENIYGLRQPLKFGLINRKLLGQRTANAKAQGNRSKNKLSKVQPDLSDSEESKI